MTQRLTESKGDPDFIEATGSSIESLIFRLQQLTASPTLTLAEHFKAGLSCGCKINTDRITITLNISGISLCFTRQIESAEECFWAINAIAVAVGDLAPLLASGPKLRIEGANERFTSWLRRPKLTDHESGMSLSDEACITSVTQKFIELDLLLLDNIPKFPSEDSLKAASWLRTEGSLDTRTHNTGPDFAKEYTRQLPLVFNGNFQQFSLRRLLLLLASSLECGIDWIRSFGKVLQDQVAREAREYGELPIPDEKFTPDAITLLSLLGVAIDDSATFRQEYLAPVTLFLTYITDDRLQDVLLEPRLIVTGSSGQYALTNRNCGRYHLAVPVALADSAFFHNQVWLLEPLGPSESDECKKDVPSATALDEDSGSFPGSDVGDFRCPSGSSGNWRIMGKQQFFGCPTIVADGNAVKLLKMQKVYG